MWHALNYPACDCAAADHVQSPHEIWVFWDISSLHVSQSCCTQHVSNQYLQTRYFWHPIMLLTIYSPPAYPGPNACACDFPVHTSTTPRPPAATWLLSDHKVQVLRPISSSRFPCNVTGTTLGALLNVTKCGHLVQHNQRKPHNSTLHLTHVYTLLDKRVT